MSESVHDAVNAGHASTSISTALGILKAKQMLKKPGKAIAVIGDGALTGGMAFEAMNHAGHLQDDLIVILNDNDMSISRNVGALSSRPKPTVISSAISQLSIHPFVLQLKKVVDWVEAHLIVGKSLFRMLRNRIKKSIKALVLKENIFDQLGFSYIGPINGHSISQMQKVFSRVKKVKRPVVIHLLTHKGKGYKPAEGDPINYHGVGGFHFTDGKIDKKSSLNFTDLFSSIMLDQGKKNKKVVAVSAAMIEGTGLAAFNSKYPSRCFDVGIAEQHAVTFAAGLAVGGLRPVVAIYSTFMQRAIDQVIHDVAIPNLPVVFVMSRSGFVPDDGETHQGLFDISLFRGVPNLTLLSPSGKEDFISMMDYSLRHNGPVVIRIPKDVCETSIAFSKPIKEGEGVFVSKSTTKNGRPSILLVSLGGTYKILNEVSNNLAHNQITSDHYNLRFAKPLNRELLLKTFSSYKLVVFAEEAVALGGVGEELKTILLKAPSVDHLFYGAPDNFIPHATRRELFKLASIDSGTITKDILAYLKK